MTTLNLNIVDVRHTSPAPIFVAAGNVNGDKVVFVNDGRLTCLLLRGSGITGTGTIQFSIAVPNHEVGTTVNPIICNATVVSGSFLLLLPPFPFMWFGKEIELTLIRPGGITALTLEASACRLL